MKEFSRRELLKRFGFIYIGRLKEYFDYPELGMDECELEDKLEAEENQTPMSGTGDWIKESALVSYVTEAIKYIVEKRSGEKPWLIRYFAIPNKYSGFDLGCMCKIYNNGESFILANDLRLFEIVEAYDIESIEKYSGGKY